MESKRNRRKQAGFQTVSNPLPLFPHRSCEDRLRLLCNERKTLERALKENHTQLSEAIKELSTHEGLLMRPSLETIQRRFG